MQKFVHTGRESNTIKGKKKKKKKNEKMKNVKNEIFKINNGTRNKATWKS